MGCFDEELYSSIRYVINNEPDFMENPAIDKTLGLIGQCSIGVGTLIYYGKKLFWHRKSIITSLQGKEDSYEEYASFFEEERFIPGKRSWWASAMARA